ncbi:50S ribosomal protein L3 N(5)-glutamine methyltransferase [Paracandidimonas soli]|uniref:Ribosomal protein uL3 glutamine methyltransferase n=1 Tax=Paracandidimonas soli TaxID=1917182 RepID=A0A4R3VAP6_9BURK|nr:50S ribosomal protein L3 N(5)-glutamine methyltransferase [Paracandidimonas soli]TCV00843.1 [LSU ribosomal protein L3P]-glutamine N5-methyltransferase [Paracandidimonas soli]
MHATAYRDLLTVRDLLRYAVSRFRAAELVFGHGSDNAWDEAVYLLLHTLNLPLDTLDPFLDARVLPEERKQFLDLIGRRISERKPAAYLTGEAWLQGQRFIVNENVIVPRSPIAELLSEGLTPWVADPESVVTVLDMCTGSGCLAILAAYAFENALVDAVDISEAALEVTAQNIALHGLQGRVSAHQSDLFDNLPPCDYSLILCNPPYVNANSMHVLPAEYMAEPDLALAGGEDGMDLVRRILEQAPAYMADDGLLILEIGNEYDNFLAAFPDLDPIWLSTAEAEDQIVLLNKSQLLT